jgi:hypothetical protein
VVLIFRYTGERFGKESGKITWAKKKLCRYWALINIVSGQNNLFNSMPILFFPIKQSQYNPYFKLILIVT